MTFSERMPGDNRIIEGLTRPNSLFLSAAAQNNHTALLPVYRWFSQSFGFAFGERSHWLHRTAELCSNPDHRAAIVRLLAFADLGISDLDVTQESVPDDVKKLLEGFKGVMAAQLPLPLFDESRQRLKLVHQIERHTITFDEEQESEGTLAYLRLLGVILRALAAGSIVCVDELDASLHPLLTVQLVNLFNSKETNPNSAQLIFNTHDSNLLSRDLLRRDQIWFAEKKRDGASVIYPLSDFRPRKDENLERGYLQGRYGAIPFLNSDSLNLCWP